MSDHDVPALDVAQVPAQADQWTAFARRQTDVHAGLARERLIDLRHRLILLSSALTNRGDDLVADIIEQHALDLTPLHHLLATLESAGHTWTRGRLSDSNDEAERLPQEEP